MHCGGCNQDIGDEAACFDGLPHCPAERPTLCGQDCVDRSAHVEHVCDDGEAVCPENNESSCGADGCIDLTDDKDNCGACGRACPDSGNPWCVESGRACEEYQQYADRTRTCDQECAELGMGYECDRAGWLPVRHHRVLLPAVVVVGARVRPASPFAARLDAV